MPIRRDKAVMGVAIPLEGPLTGLPQRTRKLVEKRVLLEEIDGPAKLPPEGRRLGPSEIAAHEDHSPPDSVESGLYAAFKEITKWADRWVVSDISGAILELPGVLTADQVLAVIHSIEGVHTLAIQEGRKQCRDEIAKLIGAPTSDEHDKLIRDVEGLKKAFARGSITDMRLGS